MSRKVVIFLGLVLLSVVFCAQISRITHLLHFLNANVGTEPGSGSMRLHPAYYGTEILNTLSRHPGYIQKNVLLASDYTYKLATFVISLQSTVESDGDFGGFQTFPSEKKDFEVYDGEFVSTVVNSYFAGRVLEISDSPLGGEENYLKKVDTVAALKFLSQARKDDLYVLYPGAEQVSVASVYYGTKAWKLFSTYAEVPEGVSAVQPEAIAKFLKTLFHEGGFKHSADAAHADLQSTYQAVSLLKTLNLWDSFASTRKDVQESIQKFVLAHRDAASKAFGEKAGAQPDIANTFWAVSIAKLLGLEHVVDASAVAGFVASLQSHTDGGFKLHQAATSGHHINTFYALETLELTGKVSVLEESLVHTERIVLAPKFIHNASFVAVVVLFLVAFAGALYLLPRSSEEEEEAESEGAGERTKSKEKKKKKKEPTMTIFRNKETKECVDKDGVPYPIDNLNKKEWDIVETKELGVITQYVLKKKDSVAKQKVKESPLTRRVKTK